MATPNSADANKGDPNKVSFIISLYTPELAKMAKNMKPMGDIIKPLLMIVQVNLTNKIFALKYTQILYPDPALLLR